MCRHVTVAKINPDIRFVKHNATLQITIGFMIIKYAGWFKSKMSRLLFYRSHLTMTSQIRLVGKMKLNTPTVISHKLKIMMVSTVLREIALFMFTSSSRIVMMKSCSGADGKVQCEHRPQRNGENGTCGRVESTRAKCEGS